MPPTTPRRPRSRAPRRRRPGDAESDRFFRHLFTSMRNGVVAITREGAIADLADALEANITTAAGPVALSERHRQSFESQIAEIKSGVHDYLFGQASRVGMIFRQNLRRLFERDQACGA